MENLKAYFNAGMPGSISFQEYIQLTSQLVTDRKTTGPNQSDFYVDLTKLNLHRMQRILKTTKLNNSLIDRLQESEPQQWLMITEAWCGDAAQNGPVLSLMADAAPHISLRVVLRDEHTELIDEVLTNGGRSIPRLVAFNAQGEVRFVWGPRPEPAQAMVLAYKALPEPKKSYADFSVEVQKWYATDATATLQSELMTLI